MAKVIPTTKSCNEICRLITGHNCNKYDKYVQMTFDPTSTHALYGVRRDEASSYVDKIKSIGGKYIRTVKGRDRSSPYVVICFALEMTPGEALKAKMELEENERRQQAFASKLTEIQLSPMLIAVGATREDAQKNFARWLLNSSILDPMLPFESYVIMDKPRDKDEMRIADIVKKSNEIYEHCIGMCTTVTAYCKMKNLACQMNRKITDEDKRMRRRAACLHYGLKFLAECFSPLG